MITRQRLLILCLAVGVAALLWRQALLADQAEVELS